MCKRNLRLLISLCTMVTFAFSQDVTLTVQPNGDLDYESTADIYGFQFSFLDGCADDVGGGDAVANGFTVSTGPGTALGFSFSGSFVPLGSGTLVNGVNCSVDQLSNLVLSGINGSNISGVFVQGLFMGVCFNSIING